MTNIIFQKDEIIKDRYIVQEILGQGAFAQVLKVLDTMVNEVYALKMLVSEEDQHEELLKEYRILRYIDHPNIVRLYDVDVIPKAYFLKLEYVSSEPLTSLIAQKKVSFSKAKDITIALLGALDYLHSKKIAHRDIKPANILMSERGPVLADFNVSVKGFTSGSTGVGTQPYQPPEVKTEGWHIEGDLYSLGVVIFEMLTGVSPFKGHEERKESLPDPAQFNKSIGNDLASFILRSIAYQRTERFQTPKEMLDALDKVDWVPVKHQVSSSDLVNLVHIPLEEKERSNYNPYLNRFLTLYSQSQISNARTRGLDDFAEATYVNTRLDDHLAPVILSGRYRLVLITGNAGDGKTAFIRKFENQLKENPETQYFKKFPSDNGSEFVYKGQKFLTNYDGSQDEGDIKNDDVLMQFLMPFAGKKAPLDSVPIHIIAINEGRLLDFVHQHRAEFVFLSETLGRMFDRGNGMESSILLVNLNLRSVVSDDEQGSIFDQLIDRFVQSAFWEPCERCDLRTRCYVKFNIESLQDANFGRQITERLKTLVRIVHFRQRMHITVRDMRSALSLLLFGTLDCEDIHSFANDESRRMAYISNFYYNSWFENGKHEERQSNDRLVSLLDEVDPGKVTNPILDAKLAFGPSDDHSWLFPTFDNRKVMDTEWLDMEFREIDVMRQQVASNSKQDALWSIFMSQYRRSHESLRRKYFFERTDEGWVTMLPYRQYQRFYDEVKNKNTDMQSVRDRLLLAITKSDGFQDPNIALGGLIIRTSGERLVTMKSFKHFKKDRFTSQVMDIGKMTDFIEFLPANIFISSDTDVSLDVNLDLFEMLERILEGFRPSMNDLRGSFINLLIFKRQLSNERFDEVLLTQNESTFYRVRKVTFGSLRMDELHGGV